MPTSSDLYAGLRQAIHDLLPPFLPPITEVMYLPDVYGGLLAFFHPPFDANSIPSPSFRVEFGREVTAVEASYTSLGGRSGDGYLRGKLLARNEDDLPLIIHVTYVDGNVGWTPRTVTM